MEVEGSNKWYSRRCAPEEKLTSGGAKIPISNGAEDAIALTKNFIYYYRCASHSAGNGRQVFEVPSFLTLVGTATATALGAGSTVAIAGGAASATFDGAKDYYSPMEKAEIYDKALDAFICINSVATGTEPFATSADLSLNVDNEKREESEGTYFSAERQFFELVSGGLLSVERIAADRLRRAGNYDPAGVVAQIQLLTQEINNKGGDPGTPGSPTENGGSGDGINDVEANAPAPTAQQKRVAERIVENQSGETDETMKQDLTLSLAESLQQIDIMQSKLQLCVMRAKL